MLRLEHLFDVIHFHSQAETEFDNRVTFNTLLAVVDLLSRSDIKSELLKELERHSTTLNELASNPAVDQSKLSSILENLADLLQRMHDKSNQPGQYIRQNELLYSVKQRASIPGGSCSFDLPAYHYWLNQPFNIRKLEIAEMQKDLNIINEATKLCLQLVRTSTSPSKEEAEEGFFQKAIDSNQSCQLIRVILAEGVSCFPEISGGKHRFTVRFMQQESASIRPSQLKEKIHFELHCCVI